MKPQGDLNAKKILAIDDSKDANNLLCKILQRQGCKVITAMEGKSGLELAKKEEPDIILLDIKMPGMSGVDVFEELKKNPLTKLIPVIMVSAVDEVDSKVNLLNMGADDYITKPYDSSELSSRVKALFRRTEGLTKSKRFDLKLTKYLITKFESRGYQVFTSLVPSYPGISSKWQGTLPDLLARKGKKKIAISMESMESLLNPITPDRWKDFLKNPGVDLKVVVKSKECWRAALLLRKEHVLKFKIIHEKEQEDPEISFKTRLFFYRYVASRKSMLILLCVLAAFILSLIGGSLLFLGDYLNQGINTELQYHKPRDKQRQVDLMEKSLKILKDKSKKKFPAAN